MIESEINRQKLLEILERWAKNVKVLHLLREYDIPGLVDSIQGVYYHIQLSCGHKVRTLDEGIDIQYDENDGTTYGSYCQDCAKRVMKYHNAKKLE
jgi:hypothetical protein